MSNMFSEGDIVITTSNVSGRAGLPGKVIEILLDLIYGEGFKYRIQFPDGEIFQFPENYLELYKEEKVEWDGPFADLLSKI